MSDIYIKGDYLSFGNNVLKQPRGVAVPFALPTTASAVINPCVNATAYANTSGVANSLTAVPFFPTKDIWSNSFFINVTATSGGSLVRILVYSELNGLPYEKLYESVDIDSSTTGLKQILESFTFLANTKYFLTLMTNANIPTATGLNAASLMPFPSTSLSNLSNYFGIRVAVTYGSAPNIWSGGNLQIGNPIFIGLTL